MTILSASDRTFWEENGYVIIRNAVPKEDCSAVVDAIWEFLDMDRNNPETWYSKPAWHSRAGMIEMYHHQSMWNNRQNPKVHQAFSEIYGSEKLWVSLDRVNMNPPATADWDYQGFIHWDIDPTVQPVPLRTQGVLCLADTNEAQGGFQCIPGSHLHVAEIVAAQTPDSNLRNPNIGDMQVKSIAANAGDLIIWHVGLLHGNGRNRTQQPRLAQYITMSPANEADEEQRQRRIELWQNRLPPDYKRAFPGDPRQLEEKFGKTAELTDLGKKLVGVVRW